MTTENSNTPHPERNPLAEDSVRSVTAPGQSTDEFLEVLADHLGLEFRKLIEAMPNDRKREVADVARLVIDMNPEQRARIAKCLPHLEGGDL